MQPHQKRGVLIAAMGLVVMLAGGFTASDFRYRIAPSRFLVQPMNIATTPDELQIVVGSMFSKLHVLDPEGRIQAAWQLPTDGGPFRVALAADDRIRVATLETGLLLEYDFAGELIEEREDAEAYERFGPEHEHGFTAPSGTQYLLEDGHVLRATSESQTILLNGFANHEAITLRVIGMGLALFLGVLMLVGGFVTTGRPRDAGAEPH
jgi:hypothetical protein